MVRTKKRYKVGNQEITISDRDFLADGGEASVYAQGGTAIKIYADPARCIPPAKFKELSVLADNRIIKPEALIFDGHIPVGYTMPLFKGEPVCRLFTQAFKDRNGITTNTIADLVLQLREVMLHVHKHAILVVDFNEMNSLVNDKFNAIALIDTDSWQTKSFPATAIMESIRDRHGKPGVFDEKTDWFAWATVTIQMFMGIHPYKGGHPKVKTMDERMVKNLSVFDKSVKLPACCPPLSSLPQSYHDWYLAVFQNGCRDVPPDALVPVVVVSHAAMQLMGAFTMTELMRDLAWTPVGVAVGSDGLSNICVIAPQGAVYAGQYVSTPTRPVVAFHGAVPVAGWIEDGMVKLVTLPDKDVVRCCDLQADALAVCGGAIYAKCVDRSVRLEFHGKGKTVLMTPVVAGEVMPHATSMYPGVVVQRMLGNVMAMIPDGSGAVYAQNLMELTDYHVISAKAEVMGKRGVLMIVGCKKSGSDKGRYDRLVYAVDVSGEKPCRLAINHEGVQPADPNFAITSGGVCLSIDEGDDVEMFDVSHPEQAKKLDNTGLDGSVRLHACDGKILGIRGNAIFRIQGKA
jgi:hypothetical protein